MCRQHPIAESVQSYTHLQTMYRFMTTKKEDEVTLEWLVFGWVSWVTLTAYLFVDHKTLDLTTLRCGRQGELMAFMMPTHTERQKRFAFVCAPSYLISKFSFFTFTVARHQYPSAALYLSSLLYLTVSLSALNLPIFCSRSLPLCVFLFLSPGYKNISFNFLFLPTFGGSRSVARTSFEGRGLTSLLLIFCFACARFLCPAIYLPSQRTTWFLIFFLLLLLSFFSSGHRSATPLPLPSPSSSFSSSSSLSLPCCVVL